MAEVFLVVGPPGCGKTTFLANEIADKAGKYGPEEILVTSFTKAAAMEIASRGLPLPDRNVGTLHALCLHEYGEAKVIADTPKGLKLWNAVAPPGYQMSGGRSGEDPFDKNEMKEADRTFALYQRYRQRLIPRGYWAPHVLAMAQAWEDWKGQVHYPDFTDLLEFGLRELSFAPGMPSIMYVDEAQDLTPLQAALIRQWAEPMRYLVVVLDPDQCIYQWLGANPSLFFNPDMLVDHRRVLGQSYRVPQAAYLASQKWIKQLEDREDTPYKPTDVAGSLEYSPAYWEYPDPLLEHINNLPPGEDMMVLASCGYMLNPLISLLRSNGIPFHNPYTNNRGDWNPLRPPGKDEKTTVSRVLSYLRPADSDTWWTGKELSDWTDMLYADKLLVYGAKEKIKKLPDRGLAHSEVSPLFTDLGISLARSFDPAWMEVYVRPDRKNILHYVLGIYKNYGLEGITKRPRVIVGTNHSVKGGQADHVAIFPDLSDEGNLEYQVEPGNVARPFYVAMTRTRNSLIFCSPTSARSVSL